MKRIFVMLLILAICLSSGCGILWGGGASSTPESSQTNTSDTSTSSSSSTQPEEPPVVESKYEPYKVYLFDIMGEVRIPQSQIIWVEDKKGSITEEDVEDGAFTIGDIHTTGVYSQTSFSVSAGRAMLTRYYRTPYGEVGVDTASGRIVSVNFKTSKQLDVDAATAPLSQAQCKQIALEFLLSVGFSPSAEYVSTESERTTFAEGTEYARGYYRFYYKRYIDDLSTTDVCNIQITEYGRVMYFQWRDSYDVSRIEALNVDYDRASGMAEKFAESIGGQYQISKPSYQMLVDGTYALTYMIIFGDDADAGLEILIPIGK